MSNRVKVRLIPMGNRIKYEIFGKMYCSRMKSEMPNSRTFDKKDFLWLRVFGNKRKVEKFLHRNKTITTVCYPELLGYSACDSTNPGSIK